MRRSSLPSACAVVGALLVLGGCSVLDGGDESVEPTGPAKATAGNPDGKEAGGECGAGEDCKSGVCEAAACAPAKPDDGVKNGDESDVDCGGSTTGATACADGKGCATAKDCTSQVCANAVCQAPKGDDGAKNGDESDVDCGGSTTGAPRCATDKACSASEDCDSLVCDGTKKTCNAPTATDKVKNGDESDVDCGGSTTGAPRCDVAKSCNANGDCASDGCDDTKKCAVGRSCTQTNGGRTCGVGEVGAANAQHESCCIALPIPGSATRLDKYKVTAGRMRAFVERTGGDVKGWYQANKAQLSARARGQIDPYVANLPTSRTADANGADFQLGGTIYLTDRPSTSQGCFTGNAGNQANGSHTFWTGTLEQEDRGFDQAFLDRLPLNCVPFPLMAAFCAWDGGRLQTFEENSAAYGPGFYPWGNAPEAGGFASVNGAWTAYGPGRYGAAQGACPTCDTARANWLNNYQFPAGGNALKPWDYAFYMSPPGRFAGDTGPGGHKDLGGVMMELTASQGPNDAKYGTTVKWSRAGSWEGHPPNYGLYAFAIMTKYGKAGGRCARD
jgi:hypothetical protein